MLRFLASLLVIAAGATHALAETRGALALTLADADAPVTLYSKSYALVIGIDAYKSRGGKSWPRLSNAINDAKAVAASLEKRGFEVSLETNLKSGDLEDTLRQFFIHKGNDREARLFVWFAGHGHTVKLWESSPPVGYLVPADAPLPSKDNDAFFRRKALPLSRFGEFMREARAKHVLAVFDSCFSGSAFITSRALPSPHITRATTLPVRQMVSSGEALQTVSDDGMFRRLFVDALSGDEPSADANKDGYLTGTELGLFLSTKLTNLTMNRQSPRYGKLRAFGLDRGDFVFRINAQPTKPSSALPPARPPLSLAAEAWGAVKDTKRAGDLEAFVKRFPDSFFADLARSRLEELKEQKVAVGVFPEKPKPEVGLGFEPGDEFQDCTDCPKMVVVPAGSFTMGSPGSEPERSDDEGPQRRVTIPQAFAVGKFEVTFAEWDACVSDGGCSRKPGDRGWGRGSRPVINVSWDDAKAYVGWLSRKTGKEYRLLSEAEWEYAARAGTKTPFSTGQMITTDQANFDGNYIYNGSPKGLYREQTVTVGSFSANAFGLHDMHGNLWEWVEDCWNDKYTGAPSDGRSWTTGECSLRVLRGGSWDFGPRGLRSANRDRVGTDIRLLIIGFRVARTL